MGNEASLVREVQAQSDGEAPPRLVLHLDVVMASAMDQALLHPEAEPASPPWRRTHHSQDKELLKASVEEDIQSARSSLVPSGGNLSEPNVLDADSWSLQPRGQGASLFATVLIDGEQVKAGRVERFPSAVIELKPHRWTSMVQINFFLSSPNSSSSSESRSLAIRRPEVWSTLSAQFVTLVHYGAPLYASLWVGLNSIEQTHTSPDRINIELEEAVKRACSADPNVPKVKITVYKPSADARIPTSQPTLKSTDRNELLGSETWPTRPRTDPDVRRKLTSGDTMPSQSLDSRKAKELHWNSQLPHPDATSILRSAKDTFAMYHTGDNRSVGSKPLSQEGFKGLIRCLQESNSIADMMQKQFTEDANRRNAGEEPQVILKITNEFEQFHKMFLTAQQKWRADKVQIEAEADRIRKQIECEIDHHDAIIAGLNSGHSEEIVAISNKIVRHQQSLQSRIDALEKDYQRDLQLAKSEEDARTQKRKAQVDDSRTRFKEDHQDELERHMAQWERAHQQAWNAKEQALREERERHDYQLFVLQKQIDSHRQAIDDTSLKKEKLMNKLDCESAELEQETHKVRAEKEAQMLLTNATTQSNLKLLKQRQEHTAMARQEELRLLRAELERSKQHRQEVLEQADTHFALALQKKADAHDAKLRENTAIAANRLAGVVEEHKTHMGMKTRHLELKTQVHDLQVSNLSASIEKETEHAAQLADQIAALKAEIEPLSRQVADLDQMHSSRAEEHGIHIDDLVSQISSNELKAGRHRIESTQKMAAISQAHTEHLQSRTLEHSNVLDHWDSALQHLSDDLAEQEQRAQQRYNDMKSIWEQKHANANEALQGTRDRLAKSEARAAETLEERSRDLSRQVESAVARRSEEVSALKLQLARLTEAGQQETARLQREILDAEQEAGSVLARISAEVDKQLQQHSTFQSVSQQSLAGEHAEQVERTRQTEIATLAQLRRAHEAWKDPLQSELDRLRQSRIELQEAKQQERTLTQEITHESTLLEVERTANSERTQQSVSKRNELSTLQAELAQVTSEVEKAESQNVKMSDEFKQLQETHRAAVTGAWAKKEAAMSGIGRDLEDLQKRIDQQRNEAESLHDLQMQDLEVKLTAEKHSLELQVASLENELEDARSAADRARKELMGDLRSNLEMVNADTAKALADLQEEQKTLATLREQRDVDAYSQKRDVDVATAKILEGVEDEISKRREAKLMERQSHVSRHEAYVKQLQMAHGQEKQSYEDSFADHQRLITSLRATIARKEKEHDDASAEVARLRKEIFAIEEQKQRSLQDALESQKSSLSQARELFDDKQALIRREAKAHHQHLVEQLQNASTNASNFASDLSNLQGTADKQRLVAQEEAERKRAEIAELNNKLAELKQAHQAEREEIGRQLQNAEHRARLQQSKTDGGKQTASNEYSRLERELESLKDRLADEERRHRNVQQDIESQDQRLKDKFLQELEHQERGFEAQRQSHSTAHRSDASVRELELRQAAEQIRAQRIMERHRIMTEIAEHESQIPRMESLSQRTHMLRQELSEHRDRHHEQIQAHQKEVSDESRRHEDNMAELKSQHRTKREEESLLLASSLSKRKQEGQDHTQRLMAQLEEARQKAVVAKQIKESRQTLFDTVVAERKESTHAEALKQMEMDQGDIKQSLEAQLVRDKDALEGKLTDAAVEQRYAIADFERQLAEQQTLHQLQLAEEEERARRDAEKAVEKQRALEQQVKAAQKENEFFQASLDDEANSHNSQYTTSTSESSALQEVKRQLRHSQQRLQQELEDRRAEMQARIKKVQEDCDTLVQEAQLSASQESAVNTRAEIASHRLELSRAQEDANMWQKRCDFQLKHLEQASFADSFKSSSDVDLHPLQHIANRVIFRLYRLLVQEKQGKLSDVELEGVFRELPRDDGGYVRLSREEFLDLVRRCEDLQRTLYVRQAFRAMDSQRRGEVEEHEFILQPLGLDRDTLSHVFFIVEGSGRAQREAHNRAMQTSGKRAFRAITEDYFVSLFARAMLPYSENLLIDDTEDPREHFTRVLVLDSDPPDLAHHLAETSEHSDERYESVLSTLRMLGQSRETSRELPSSQSASRELPIRKTERRASGFMESKYADVSPLHGNPLHPTQPSASLRSSLLERSAEPVVNASQRLSGALRRPSMFSEIPREAGSESEDFLKSSDSSFSAPSRFLSEVLGPTREARRSPSSSVDVAEEDLTRRLSGLLGRRGSQRERKY